MGFLGSSTEGERKLCSLDPVESAEAFKLCCNNVTTTIGRLSPFLEPTVSNIEALLFGVSLNLHQDSDAKTNIL